MDQTFFVRELEANSGLLYHAALYLTSPFTPPAPPCPQLAAPF